MRHASLRFTVFHFCAAGNPVAFSSYKGKVVLVTNVACACGYTSGNYKELAQLHDK